MIAAPRDAATLILMRDVYRARSGIQILLVRRHAMSAFLPGAYVFPGGKVETADYTDRQKEFARDLVSNKLKILSTVLSRLRKRWGSLWLLSARHLRKREFF